jgi:hypothetical protein
MQALKRVTQPDDIGGVVAFLASDDARWNTGDTRPSRWRLEALKPFMRGTMESPEISYLYTIALLGISFMGFAAIVMLLREALGGHLGPFDVLFARVYMEGALIVSMGAMLPPLLMFWALSTGAVWRLCSGLVGVPLLGIALSYPARRRATTGKSTPRYVRVNTTIVLLISLTLLIDATGLLHERSGPAFLAALTAFLTFSLVGWLQALSIILVPVAKLK